MEKLDKLIGLFAKTKDQTDLLSTKLYQDIEPRVKALEEK